MDITMISVSGISDGFLFTYIDRKESYKSDSRKAVKFSITCIQNNNKTGLNNCSKIVQHIQA